VKHKFQMVELYEGGWEVFARLVNERGDGTVLRFIGSIFLTEVDDVAYDVFSVPFSGAGKMRHEHVAEARQRLIDEWTRTGAGAPVVTIREVEREVVQHWVRHWTGNERAWRVECEVCAYRETIGPWSKSAPYSAAQQHVNDEHAEADPPLHVVTFTEGQRLGVQASW
jgi:hypothetical protein